MMNDDCKIAIIIGCCVLLLAFAYKVVTAAREKKHPPRDCRTCRHCVMRYYDFDCMVVCDYHVNAEKHREPSYCRNWESKS